MTLRSSFGISFKPNNYFEVTTADLKQKLQSIDAEKAVILGENTNSIFNESVALDCVRYIDNELSVDGCTITAGASINWHELVKISINNNLYGLENLAHIPGSVGASPIQNIGAYGQDVSQVIKFVECIDLESLEIFQLTKNECNFSYRSSIFQSRKYLITKVSFELETIFKPNLKYKSLSEYVAKNSINVSKDNIIETIGRVRALRLPDIKVLPNCGSFFKNPIVDSNQDIDSKIDIIEISESFKKLSAASMIGHIKNKLKLQGGIELHKNHDLVLTNPKNASFSELLESIESIKNTVFNEFGIPLQTEPIIYK